jgi:hypothetical protein
MALFKAFKGKRADLAKVALHEGYAYFCVDDGSFHTDQINASGTLERIQLNAKNAETLCGMSLEEFNSRYVLSSELAPVATSGLIDDLSLGEDTELILDCGDAGIRMTENEANGETVVFTQSSSIESIDENPAGGQTAVIN